MPHGPEAPSPRATSLVARRFRQADRLLPRPSAPSRHSASPTSLPTPRLSSASSCARWFSLRPSRSSGSMPPLRDLSASSRRTARAFSACSILVPQRCTRRALPGPFASSQRRPHRQTCRALAPPPPCGEQIPPQQSARPPWQPSPSHRLTTRCSGPGCYLVLLQVLQFATRRLPVARGSRAAERQR
jgi:hypothetical protein